MKCYIMKSDIQCILCKYRKNPKMCVEKLHDYDNWDCPTLSNIWYGKLANWFPFNIIYKIQLRKELKMNEP